MAAFCGCCGAEITMKAEKCAVCGMPRHGMIEAKRVPAPDMGASQLKTEPEKPLGSDLCCEW